MRYTEGRAPAPWWIRLVGLLVIGKGELKEVLGGRRTQVWDGRYLTQLTTAPTRPLESAIRSDNGDRRKTA